MALILDTIKGFGGRSGDKTTGEINYAPVVDLVILDEDGIELFIPDASILEQHRSEVEFTDNPIELGAEITDHAIILPRTFTVEGRITNTPLRRNNDLFTDVYELTDISDRVQGAWSFLNGILNERALVSVVTNLQKYENFAMKSLETNQDWQTSQVLDFTIVFRELFIAKAPETLVEEIELPKGDVADQATPTLSVGNVDFLDFTPVEVNSVQNSVSVLEFTL